MIMEPFKNSEQRREHILKWLQEQQVLAIDDLASRLSVSIMTVHRDLEPFVSNGVVEKSYGKVRLRSESPAPHAAPAHGSVCAMCHTAISDRTMFTIHLSSGNILTACCAHCGLIMMKMQTGAYSALTKDFLHGLMVNVLQAYFVVNSRIQACCVPSVLCFATAEDASAFQLGFGGEMWSFEETTSHLTMTHHHKTHPMDE